MAVFSGVSLQWIVIFIVTVLLVLIGHHVLFISDYWKKREVPFEKPLIVIGNLGFALRKSAWDYFYELRSRNPAKLVGIFLGWKPALVVQTPELARQVIVKDAEVFQNRYIYSNSSDPLGSLNLFTVDNPTWTNMRHELSPLFTSLRLKYITEVMNINATEVVKKIKRDFIDKKQPVHLKKLFTQYTSDTAAYTVFGLTVSSLSDGESPLTKINETMVNWTLWRGFEFTVIFVLPYIGSLLRLKLFSPKATENIKQLFWSVVKEWENKRLTSDKNVVAHLLKLKETSKLPVPSGTELADELMLAQTAFLLLGTMETSSSTITYTLHELAHHPDEQEALHNEINEALEKSGTEFLQYDELMELKYLSSCIYETLRKYPPVPYLDRICSKPYELDGVKLDRGTPVLVNLLALHYNKDLHPDPERWDPSRGTATSDNDNLNYTYLPFGDGPRFCIGKRYGLMQVRAVVAQIIHKYKLEPGAGPYKIKHNPFSVFLGPKNGGIVKFISR